MLESDKTALHYDVIANTAHKIELVSKELSSLYKSSYFNTHRAKIKKEHLKQYIEELQKLYENK